MVDDASDFYRWMCACYLAGQADALGCMLPDLADAAPIVAIIRADVRLRQARDVPPAERPGWLEALVEATPEAIERQL